MEDGPALYLDDVMIPNKYIGWLDVPVNDVVLVQMLQPLADLDYVLPDHLLHEV